MEIEGFDALDLYVNERVGEFALIPGERKEDLGRLAGKIRKDLDLRASVHIIFICTQNSRRSHMSHLWAQFAARYNGVNGISCFSGGTEATSFNPLAVKTMQHAGMKIIGLGKSGNPPYAVSFEPGMEEISVFSKHYSDPPNPVDGFVAVMTCNDADNACPVVHGAESRFSIPYEDPKVSDGTPDEEARYADRCSQIAREMLYLFSEVKEPIDSF